MTDPFICDEAFIKKLSDDQLVTGLAEADAKCLEWSRARSEADALAIRWLGIKTMIEYEQWLRLTPDERDARNREMMERLGKALGWPTS